MYLNKYTKMPKTCPFFAYAPLEILNEIDAFALCDPFVYSNQWMVEAGKE
jgi:hypothetical protein